MQTAERPSRLDFDALEFAPGILRLRQQPPSPLPRVAAWTVLVLLGAMLAWAAVGRLDVIAVAQGKLVPASHLQIVQPSEPGAVREILVQEGDRVEAGQVLMRMDGRLADAESRALFAEMKTRSLQVRRIDAELSGGVIGGLADDPPDLLAQARSQAAANRRAHEDALAQERAALARAGEDLAASEAQRAKLEQVLPMVREREQIYEKLGQEGFAGKLMVLERSRERVEKEQDLRAQAAAVEGLKAAIAHSERRLAQLDSQRRQQLQRERTEAMADLRRLEGQWAKQQHRTSLLELKAPQAGTVKDLATHTPGTVVQPGTVLMTLVPAAEPLQAEVWIANQDVGFVQPGQAVRVKLAGFPFQKYGLVEGRVLQVGADASEPAAGARLDARSDPAAGGLSYRASVALEAQSLEAGGKRYPLAPGMQVAAEILLGDRTVLEYLLSPVQKTFREAGRER